MKKFLTTLIYGSLACIVLIYLFSTMRWPGFQNVAVGVLWLHVGAYLLYSLMIIERDTRIIYPLTALSVVVLVAIFKIGANFSYMGLVVYVFLAGYTGFHLLVKDFLDTNEIHFLKKLNLTALSIYLISGIMKIAKLEYCNELFTVGSGLLALSLLLTGATKGLRQVRQ